MKKADVIIVGGGLAGLTLAALLGAGGAKVICLDREEPAGTLAGTFDGRTTAISWGSQKVLAVAGVWDDLAPQSCPIETIRILDGGSPVLLEFSSAEVGGEIFGWIAENRAIRHILYEKIRTLKTVAHIAPASVSDFSVTDDVARVRLDDGTEYEAALVVGADGRGSLTREEMGIGTRNWSYRQRAVICNVIHDNPHHNAAIEDFRPEGPFAILPLTDDADGNHRSSVVWTEHEHRRTSALHDDQETFDAALNARFPESYGRVRQAGRRFGYPLGLVHAHRYIAPRMALVADAAHGIHPIAGQGLNLGFRDIAVLAGLVNEAVREGQDPGARVLLESYQRQRCFDNMAMAGATDALNKLFSNDILPVRLARKAGLRAVSRLPFAKRFFMRQAMGAAGILPAMIGERRDAA